MMNKSHASKEEEGGKHEFKKNLYASKSTLDKDEPKFEIDVEELMKQVEQEEFEKDEERRRIEEEKRAAEEAARLEEEERLRLE